MITINEAFGYRRSFACVDLGAIKNNFDELRKCIPETTKTMAVVKADAYGHGSVKVAKALADRADYFAVAVIDEALELRENGINNPILILTYTSPYQFETLINNGFIPTVYSFSDAKRLSDTAVKLGKKVVIHIAVDTGMSRIGLADTEESVETIKNISALPMVEIEGIFSHFACADCEDKTCALGQKKRFDNFVETVEKAGINIPLKHMNNSAGTIDFDFSYDIVRIGIALYGLYPSDEVDKSKVKLTPAMEVFSHIIHIKDIEKGVSVGYGHTYTAPERRTVATVCIGYADGFNRAFSNRGYVLVNGKKAPIIGKVCMDQIMVDITGIENVEVGDYAVIMGRSGDEIITAEKLGEMSDSFNYEIICTFMPRIIRVHCEDGKII